MIELTVSVVIVITNLVVFLLQTVTSVHVYAHSASISGCHESPSSDICCTTIWNW